MVALSVAATLLLEAVHLSAARLLGPLVAAIAFATRGSSISVPPIPFLLAQAVIGGLIARSMPVSIAREMLHSWPMFLASVVSVIAASVVLGWALARWKVLPGTTAVWGSLPGAASAMALMAEAFGADVRLVAFMQYTRVLLVAVIASIVARFAVHAGAGAPAMPLWQTAWGLPFVETLLLLLGSAVVGARLKVPAGPLLLPMVLGIVAQDTGILQIELPGWLLAFAYAMVGWSIGLKFTKEILGHVIRALPRVVVSILTLIGLSGVVAGVLVHFWGVEPLTAYLATSPGGADSVAIIAASGSVDVPFVMAMQTSRFLLVLFIGPALARFAAQRTPADLARGGRG